MLEPAEVEKRLVESGAVLEVSAAAVTKTLSNLRGVTLGVTVNDRISGAIKIDFSSDPSKALQSDRRSRTSAFSPLASFVGL